MPDAPAKKKQGGKGAPWVKGQSGNPKGRPPKAVCLTSILQDYLAEHSDDPRAQGKTRAELLAMALWSQAMKGNGVAIKEIFQRIDGPVKEKLEVTGPDGEPLFGNTITLTELVRRGNG